MAEQDPSAPSPDGPTPENPAPENPANATRCGFAAMLGAPNAGKSTLVNRMTGTKVSIVSRKVQTTRTTVRGIALQGASQIILVDTPGVFAPRRRLDRAMVQRAWSGASDADVIVLLIDARAGLEGEALSLVDQVAARPGLRIVLALNKIDLVERPALLALTEALNAKIPFERTFMISALNGDGVRDLLAWLAGQMPPGPWLCPEDQVSDAPLRYLAAEITREKLFERLHDELPYVSTVETETWKTLKDGSARIEQTIYVQRESQRKIVLGKEGKTIRAIGAAARRELAEIVEANVHLFLFVKVRERWADDPHRYREMGLDFPEG